MPNNQENEQKRTMDWKMVLIISSAVIILLVGFFIIRSVVHNPLEGDWYSADSGYNLDIDDENELTLEFSIDDVYAEVELLYSMDKGEKTITLKPNPASYAEAAKDTDGRLSAQQIDEHLTEILTSFNYSLENDTLTLTDREYGEEFKFTRVR